jgi:hypothetical protein
VLWFCAHVSVEPGVFSFKVLIYTGSFLPRARARTHARAHTHLCMRQDVQLSAHHLLTARYHGPELSSLNLHRHENQIFSAFIFVTELVHRRMYAQVDSWGSDGFSKLETKEDKHKK